MKINLGCYDKKIHGFVNVDIRPECNPDIIDDAFTLKKFENNSADMIYTCHMLEHLKRCEVDGALRRWWEVLKPDGRLYISVPDIEATMKRYLYTGDLEEVMSLLYGSQRHEYDYHYCGWDFKTLSKKMRDAGFQAISKWNWWSIKDIRNVDDFSRAYLPSHSPDIRLSNNRVIEGEGKLMSLNIWGVK